LTNVTKREPAAPEGGGSETAGAEGDFEDATRASVGRLAVCKAVAAAEASAAAIPRPVGLLAAVAAVPLADALARCPRLRRAPCLLPNATDVPPCTRLLPTRRPASLPPDNRNRGRNFCYFCGTGETESRVRSSE